MKKINYVLKIIPVFICFFSCIGKVENKSNTIPIDTIPENAISFEYDEKQQRAIMIKGTLNDTIPINLFFDTGFSGSRILVSDSLKDFLGSDSCTVQISESLSLQQRLYYRDSNHIFFKYFVPNTACIGWNFFENKIIKISYLQKYIQILDNTEGLDEYNCLPFYSTPYFGVEVEVFVQDKYIKEIVLLDTGSNGFVAFNNDMLEKYGINVDNAQRVQTISHSYREYRLNADSIKAGCVLSDKQTVEFLAESNNNPYPYSGILGNDFLENFEIILDFKEFKMYIKPN